MNAECRHKAIPTEHQKMSILPSPQLIWIYVKMQIKKLWGVPLFVFVLLLFVFNLPPLLHMFTKKQSWWIRSDYQLHNSSHLAGWSIPCFKISEKYEESFQNLIYTNFLLQTEEKEQKVFSLYHHFFLSRLLREHIPYHEQRSRNSYSLNDISFLLFQSTAYQLTLLHIIFQYFSQKGLFSWSLLNPETHICLGATEKVIFLKKSLPVCLISQNAFLGEPISKYLEKNFKVLLLAKV